MWTREELKNRAKAAFRANYVKCVLAAFVLMLLVDNTFTAANSARRDSGLDLSPDMFFEEDYDSDDYADFDYDDPADIHYGETNGTENILDNLWITGVLGGIGIGIGMLLFLVLLSIQIFICNPIEAGGCAFFLENARNTQEKAGVGKIFSIFQNENYKTIVVTLFLRNLYTILWSFLLVIPGIVKGYEYRMIPYILAENPEISRQEAFRLSKDMMDGEKWNAFVLDLSFLGWQIISAMTVGLFGIFWTNPYVYATNAELYLTLKSRESDHWM